MASKAQIEANRRNARLSTGPRSAAGRDASSRNALRHGLTAEQVVIFGEAAEDFARFHEEMSAALVPADAVEEELAARVILCAWRLRRASRAEAGIVNDLAESIFEHNPKARIHFGATFHPHGVESLKMAALARYETTLERALYRAAAALERRQARRAGESVPAPIIIAGDDLTVAAGGAPNGDRVALIIENYETNPIPPPEESAGHAIAPAPIADAPS